MKSVHSKGPGMTNFGICLHEIDTNAEIWYLRKTWNNCGFPKVINIERFAHLIKPRTGSSKRFIS